MKGRPPERESKRKYAHKNFFCSFVHATAGLYYVVRHERNFRIQISIALLALFFSFFYELSTLQVFALCFSIFMVLLMECVNTALERLVDLYTLEYHPLGKVIKDVASGCVLIASLFAFCIGLLIFYQPQTIAEIWQRMTSSLLWPAGLLAYGCLAVWFVLYFKD